MYSRLLLKPALALALMVPAQAFACRIGIDQQLFDEAPPAGALRGSEIIRARFSNADPASTTWPRLVPDPAGGAFGYTLIGVARRLDKKNGREKPFPVYAVVTSCSFFWSMNFGEAHTVVDGDYYLIGRFAPDGLGRRFYAGGRRSANGRELYGGWHF